MTRKDLITLQKISGYPCITIYIPTQRSMHEREKDRIMIKNAIGKAVDKLLTVFSKEEILPYLNTLDKLGEEINYTTLLDGIVIFLNDQIGELYYVPFAVENKVIVGNHFALRDIYKALSQTIPYWVLLLSKKEAKLFKATRNHLDEIIDSPQEQNNQEGFPFSWQWDVTNDRKLAAVSSGFKDAGYKTDLTDRFMQQVDETLCKHLNKNPHEPLIVISTDANFGEFEKVTKHAPRIIAHCKGDMTRAPLKDISETAWTALKEWNDRLLQEQITNLKEKIGTGMIAYGVDDVWQAAEEGRIDTLYVEDDYTVVRDPELMDPSKLKIPDPSANAEAKYDAIEQIIDEVYKKDGTIRFASKNSLKDLNRIAALLRY